MENYKGYDIQVCTSCHSDKPSVMLSIFSGVTRSDEVDETCIKNQT